MSFKRPLIVKRHTALQPYLSTLHEMEVCVDNLAHLRDSVHLWLLEHDPVITYGAMTDVSRDLVDAKVPCIPTNRGGKATYHGPGQRVAYVIMPLDEVDLRGYVNQLEAWVIQTLATFAITAFRHRAGNGIWVADSKGGNQNIAKIAAVGVRVRSRIAYHGVSLNVCPDLAVYKQFYPCGLLQPVTSMQALGVSPEMVEVDKALQHNLKDLFQLR
ncbi:MAG: lipoyl(octanoyl) transferase LipB [Alphaproteobacteria bacterium]|nr:MAG: lipoyl(octanoyl) transferase LipB [Alphaproteobacteria bacterium]